MLWALSKWIITTWSNPGEKGISHMCSSSVVMFMPSINLQAMRAGQQDGGRPQKVASLTHLCLGRWVNSEVKQ